MDASTIMTRNLVTVRPDTPLPEVARLMVEKGISAVPVVNDGVLVGIISEGDLLHRAEIGTERRRPRWLDLFSSNASLAADYMKQHGRKAADVMTREVITITPGTPLAEIANILESRHIKRVPVVEKGRVVGIVSRANLVQALASSGGKLSSPDIQKDRDIQQALSEEMRKQRWTRQVDVVVQDGQVHLWGFVGSETERRALAVLAESIPGVRGIQDHLEYTPVYPFGP